MSPINSTHYAKLYPQNGDRIVTTVCRDVTSPCVFGHVARLDDVTPANMALQLHINVSLNRPPDRTWRRRPRNKWLDQLRSDSARPTGELWRRAVDRGHGGATTRRPSPATQVAVAEWLARLTAV